MQRLAVVLLLALAVDAHAHGPSNGGPDDPEASARLLRFDGDLATLRPLDERPVPWTRPVDAPTRVVEAPPPKPAPVDKPR